MRKFWTKSVSAQTGRAGISPAEIDARMGTVTRLLTGESYSDYSQIKSPLTSAISRILGEEEGSFSFSSGRDNFYNQMLETVRIYDALRDPKKQTVSESRVVPIVQAAIRSFVNSMSQDEWMSFMAPEPVPSLMALTRAGACNHSTISPAMTFMANEAQRKKTFDAIKPFLNTELIKAADAFQGSGRITQPSAGTALS